MSEKSSTFAPKLKKVLVCYKKEPVMQTQYVYIETQIEHLRLLIHSSSLSPRLKEELEERLSVLQPARVENLCASAVKQLTATNIRYILTFLIHMEVEDIAQLFHVDTGSVYSVRYRLRKMFPPKPYSPF